MLGCFVLRFFLQNFFFSLFCLVESTFFKSLRINFFLCFLFLEYFLLLLCVLLTSQLFPLLSLSVIHSYCDSLSFISTSVSVHILQSIYHNFFNFLMLIFLNLILNIKSTSIFLRFFSLPL